MTTLRRNILMNTQNLKLVIEALRAPKHPWADGLVVTRSDGTLCYCAVAQAYEALGGKLETRTNTMVHLGFNTHHCIVFVERETGVHGLGPRLVCLNRKLSLPEIGDLLAKEYNL